MSKSADFFDELAASWPDLYVSDPRFQRRFRLLTSLIREELSDVEPGMALDAGCGSGAFSAYLADIGWRLEAVDSSAKMIEEAQSHLGARLDAVSFQKARIDELPFPTESFELVLCLSAVEYIEDDLAAMRELARVLRPGGRLVLSVPNRRSVVRMVERSMNRVRAMLGRKAPEEALYLHFQRHQYVPRAVDVLLQELGLVNRRRRFWSVGFSGPSWLLPLFERAWWAGMYGAIYVKVADPS